MTELHGDVDGIDVSCKRLVKHVAIIDAHSRYVTLYLAKNRDEAPALVQRYIADMNAIRVTVRRLHFDNAKEFVSERMHEIARERGFQLTTSCEYVPLGKSLSH